MLSSRVSSVISFTRIKSTQRIFISCIFLLITALRFSASEPLSAPQDISITEETISTFQVSFSAVENATGYEVSYVAQHNITDAGVIRSDTTSVVISERRSNINYRVGVIAIDSKNITGNASLIVTARTAPNGVGIQSFITTPTSITLFLEPAPGVSEYEVEVINLANSSDHRLDVFPSSTLNVSNVAIMISLSPNTNHTVHARASKIGSMNDHFHTYNLTQSPFGTPTVVLTDKLSVFGYVVLNMHPFFTGILSNSTTIAAAEKQILASHQEQLLTSHQDTSSVLSVTIVKKPISNMSDCKDVGGKTACFYEMILSDQTIASDYTFLQLNNATLYSNSSVNYNAAGSYDVYSESSSTKALLFIADDGCTGLSDIRTWSLYNDVDFIRTFEFPQPTDHSATSHIDIEFSSIQIMVSAHHQSTSINLNLDTNTIYGFRQNYLVQLCIDGSTTPNMYNRRYDAYNSENTGSDAYTILHTSAPASLPSTEFSVETLSDGNGGIIKFPSSLVKRADIFQFVHNGSSTRLTLADLDSSCQYQAKLKSLPLEGTANISVIAHVRSATNQLATTPEATVIADINECISGATTCDPNASCANTVGSFTCTCKTGYTQNGTFCKDVNECLSDPCDVNAVCTDIPGSFTCTCKTGYTQNGTVCEDVNECLSDPCDVNAVCANIPGSFTCTCKTGYTQNGTVCEDVNECLSDPCDVNAVCTNIPGSFTCTCKTGYTQNGTVCEDVNECLSDPCDVNAVCTNIPGSFTCTCKTGYTQNGTVCEDVNECLSDPCDVNAVCANIPGSFTCTCKTGYTQNGTVCEDVNECLSDPCDVNAVCTNIPGSFTCTCKTGYTQNGTVCEDVNECLSDPCDVNAVCTNIPGSFTCTCKTGYTQNGTVCEDVNECLSDPCDVNAVCTNIPGSFTCTCKTGYTQKGTVCEDVNECLSDPCDVNAVCTNIPGSFTCTCKTGYTQNGTVCEDVNECLSDPCDVNAVCTNIPGSFTCTCKTGYTQNGTVCEDVNECLSDPCDVNAVCTNIPGSFTCTCKTGYTQNGTVCEDVNECISDPCDVNAVCTNIPGSFTCTCKTGYTQNGTVCEDVNECLSDPCDVNAVCTNIPGSFTCTCKTGYTQNGTVCEDVNECISDPCDVNAVCTNIPGSFTCTCKTGYTQNGTVCEDVNECLSDPCDVNAVCTNIPGSFTCTCKTGYTQNGTVCEDVNECLSDPCDINAVCKNAIGSFSCSCKQRFHGNGFVCFEILISIFEVANVSFVVDTSLFEVSYHYLLLVTEVNGLSNFTFVNVPVGSFLVSSLRPSTNYSVVVFMPELEAFSSVIYQLTTPDPISGFQMDHVGNSSFSFIWNNVQGATSYFMQIALENFDKRKRRTATASSFSSEFVIPGNTTTNAVTDLPSGTTFQVKLSAENSGGRSTPTSMTATTLPDRLSDITIGYYNGSVSIIKWSAVHGASSYQLQLARNDTSYTPFFTSERSHTFFQLDPFMLYAVSLSACNVDALCGAKYTVWLKPDCSLVNCPQDAFCQNTSSGIDCLCNNNFTGNGTHCYDVDECSTSADICPENSHCNNTRGSYICTCSVGFTGNGTSCQPFAICSNDCHENATCTNLSEGSVCLCDHGFTGNGTNCYVSCETFPCHKNASCTDSLQGPDCSCSAGFTGNGSYCEVIQTCKCHPNASCRNILDGSTCVCNAGFAGNGSHCRIVDQGLLKFRREERSWIAAVVISSAAMAVIVCILLYRYRRRITSNSTTNRKLGSKDLMKINAPSLVTSPNPNGNDAVAPNDPSALPVSSKNTCDAEPLKNVP